MKRLVRWLRQLWLNREYRKWLRDVRAYHKRTGKVFIGPAGDWRNYAIEYAPLTPEEEEQFVGRVRELLSKTKFHPPV